MNDPTQRDRGNPTNDVAIDRLGRADVPRARVGGTTISWRSAQTKKHYLPLPSSNG